MIDFKPQCLGSYIKTISNKPETSFSSLKIFFLLIFKAHFVWSIILFNDICFYIQFRSAFFYNPSLQTRSFLMLGVISSHASSHVITRTLKVMEEVGVV